MAERLPRWAMGMDQAAAAVRTVVQTNSGVRGSGGPCGADGRRQSASGRVLPVRFARQYAFGPVRRQQVPARLGISLCLVDGMGGAAVSLPPAVGGRYLPTFQVPSRASIARRRSFPWRPGRSVIARPARGGVCTEKIPSDRLRSGLIESAPPSFPLLWAS